MKIAFLHPFLLRYARGIERYTVNLASALARAGAQVDLLTWRWPHELAWEELHVNVRVRSVPTPRYYSAWFAWLPYLLHLRREHYDHIFVYFADYGEAQALSLSKRQPFSVVLHFPYSQVPHRYQAMKTQQFFERASSIIAVSEHVGREMHAYSGRACTVVPHGVDAMRFQPAAEARQTVRHRLGIPADAPLILSVCALEMRKGVQHVLQALPAIARDVPNVHYAVVGDGPDADALHGLSYELGGTDRTHFLPATPDVQAYYQAADVFALPARGEASSLASLEAMACELPVVASRQPPFDELIRPEWGCQVDAENPQELASVISKLLQDDQRRKRLGTAGRCHVLAQHDWNRIAGRYMELLH